MFMYIYMQNYLFPFSPSISFALFLFLSFDSNMCHIHTHRSQTCLDFLKSPKGRRRRWICILITHNLSSLSIQIGYTHTQAQKILNSKFFEGQEEEADMLYVN